MYDSRHTDNLRYDDSVLLPEHEEKYGSLCDCRYQPVRDYYQSCAQSYITFPVRQLK